MPSSSKFISFYFVLILLLTVFSPSAANCETNSDAGTRSETGASSISGRLIIKDGKIYIWFTKSHAAIAAGRLLVVPKHELPPELSIERYDRDPLTRAVYEIYDAWKKCEEAKGTPEEQLACAIYRLKIAEETLISTTAVLENNNIQWVKDLNVTAKNEFETLNNIIEGYQPPEESTLKFFQDPPIQDSEAASRVSS